VGVGVARLDADRFAKVRLGAGGVALGKAENAEIIVGFGEA